VQIICQLLIQLVLAGTFVIARGSRKSQLAAIGELEKAVRAVAQREALLEEAREELRRAAGSGRGRFTDQMIGKYRLGDVIGRGAMGEVYEATDAAGEHVAVKMLSQASLGNAHHVQRVVRVLDVGREPLPHLVMERLRGRDLSAILRGKTKSSMSHEQIIDMLRQAGTGITAAGAAGIIHRDLKPQNLFLAGKTWKVLDFGVSRVAEASDTLTAGQVVGTPAYMAPEQARGGAVDHRTDLYALAAIAYRALTGHTPFSGGEIVDLLYRVVHGAPRRPSTLAKLPADVDLVLALGLAKEPADRFATAAELVDAIAAALAGNLSPALRDRARALELDGAWAKPRLTSVPSGSR
jgi:serine/threonine-protein kinase